MLTMFTIGIDIQTVFVFDQSASDRDKIKTSYNKKETVSNRQSPFRGIIV